MALFGFNKQKVLANAEKYVQQGKLQNAISEYEKILKHDAKDLTVTNTVGDLYSRIGESDKATECFKSVGDAYASQGFTVKAIAMYKKISKLKPSLESLLKLAELYTQQGLFNDARAQYLQVAEEFLKTNELENAVRIFQKILEMDPENSNMRVRLAEVYIRLGKKNEAWQIFSAAAESMRSKGSLSGAEEILQRMLTLDPSNAYALLMQGKNQLEAGDANAAVATLSKIPDIDSNPEGLRDLLKAYLQTGQLSEAGAAANKLLTVHNDLTAIASFADALMQAGQYENALQVYDQHAERLLAENSDKVLEHLHAIIGHVRENPDSLQKLLDLFHKAGDTSHVNEVTELLAHASVQSGDLARARDLYQKLAQVEPQNPLHMQNYQQVVSQLSGTTGTKLITPEEAVVLLDDLEATAPSIHQHYSDEVALSVRSALTDAELFISYNMPAKALGPLVGALPLAPNDLRLNQRLATLHTRSGRFAEAAVCCRTLQTLYSDAGYPDEATRYGELADRYEERSSTHAAPPAAAEEAPVNLEASVPAELHAEPEFSLDVPAPAPEAHPARLRAKAAAAPWPIAPPAESAEEITVEPVEETEFGVVGESSGEAAAEIDLSSEWNDALTVETGEKQAEAEVAAPDEDDPATLRKIDETVDEIRFYLSSGMPEQALAALAKLQTLTSNEQLLEKIRGEVEAAALRGSEADIQIEADSVEELTAEDIPAAGADIPEAPVVAEAPVAMVPPAIEEPPVIAEAPVVAEPAAVVAPEIPVVPTVPEPAAMVAAAFAPVAPAPIAAQPVPQSVVSEPAVPERAVAEAAEQPKVLKEFVSDLESSLGDGFLPGTVAKPTEGPAPASSKPAQVTAAAQAQPGAAAKSAPVLGEFVADIEASLGEDFLKAAPVATPAETAPVTSHPSVPASTSPVAATAAPKIAAPLAASAAASAAATPAGVQVTPQPTVPSWHAPDASLPKSAVTAAPHAPAVPAASPAAAKASPFGEDAGVDLAEMFGELKQDLEADVAAGDEDPETHYNLGIAFREMGLLDEAIGELQKACQAFDRGHPFPQVMQTYTWLAQCFLEKDVPEAAVRWYARALQVPSIDGETRVALNYELASAYESSGDKPSALKHFMDVYGSNIDYRDVAERIKALKS
jgi:tetratricopeptide (TPR) repeat protein